MLVYLVWMSVFLIVGFTSIRREITTAGDSNLQKLRTSDVNFILFLFFVCGVILIGLRDGGGVDDSQYRLFYERGYGLNKVNAWLTSKEPFFILVRQLGVALGLNYKFMFIVYAVLSMTFMCFALKNYGLNKNLLAIYILGFFLIAYSPIFTTMRQTLAMAIILYYYSLEEPTKKQGILLAIAAFCVHYGSIVVVIIEFIRKKIEIKLDKLLKILIPIICFLLASVIDFQSLISKITSLIGMYDYMNLEGNYLSASNVGLFTVVMFAGYMLKVWIRKDATNMELRIESLQFIYFSVAFLTAHLRWGTRIQLYYILFVPFILIEDLECISEDSRRNVTLLLAALLIPCAIYAINQSPDIINAVRSLNFR